VQQAFVNGRQERVEVPLPVEACSHEVADHGFVEARGLTYLI
jgi:hypothetical protein